jgi:site-specific recombinase
MNIKAMVPTVIAVLVALVAYEMVVKGLISKTDAYEFDSFDNQAYTLKVAA